VLDNVAWLRLSAASGNGSKAIRLTLVDWASLGLKPGRYTARVALTAEGASSPGATVSVTLNLEAASAGPKYVYFSGPKNCVKPNGYVDEAICVVPDEKPPGGFVPPKAGGTYVDPNFGALVRIATDPPSIHSYSSPSALSAGNKYLLSGFQGNWKISDPATGRVIRSNLPLVEGSMWDAQDSEVIYTVRGTRVEKYDVRTNRTTVLVDYASSNPRFTAIHTGGAGDTSKDNWLSFYAPNEKQVCALDLSSVKTYCGTYQNIGRVQVDPAGKGTIISKGPDRGNGKRYVILIAHPAMAVYSVNAQSGRLDFEYLGPEIVDGGGNGDRLCDPGERCYIGEHLDSMEDGNGIQYLVGEAEISSPCSYNIVSLRLNAGGNLLLQSELGGGMHRVALLQNCGGQDPWVDWHLSCAKHAPYCAVSTTYGLSGTARDPNDRTTPIRRTAHLSEIFAIKGNGLEVRRLAQHRSVPYKSEDGNGYWSTPRASISFDGAYVVFDSNFGEPNRQRVAIAETGYGQTRIAQIGDAAGLQARLASGGLATILGANLSNCNHTASLPYPAELCGTTVKFGGISCPILYASTAQLNIQIPSALPAGRETEVIVQRGSDGESRAVMQIAAANVSPTAPAIFAYELGDGVKRAVVQNYDLASGVVSLNGPPGVGEGILPQTPEQIGIVYATNLGVTDPPVEDGFPAPETVVARTRSNVEVFVNGVQQQLLFAGLTPGYVGLYQVNYVLSPNTTVLPEDRNSIWLTTEDYESEKLSISLAAR
jgi:uncharacterized protein (TIGR03437 family)